MKELDIEKIERYLRRELSLEDKAAFEVELRTDPVLAEEVALRRAANDLSFVLLEDSLRAKVQAWETKQSFFRGRKRWLMLALWTGLILAGLAGWWMYQTIPATHVNEPVALGIPSNAPLPKTPEALPQQKPSAPKNQDTRALARNWEKNAQGLFSHKQVLKPLLDNKMGGHNRDNFQQGIDLLKKENFPEAASYFQNMDRAGKLDDDSRGYLFYGYSCFLSKDYPSSERCFRQVLTATYPIFKNEAEWMLCLVLYAQHGAKGKEFFTLLSSIQENDAHPFHKDAQALCKMEGLEAGQSLLRKMPEQINNPHR